MPTRSGNCPNCGAPRTGSRCEYCGTPFLFYAYAGEISTVNLYADGELVETQLIDDTCYHARITHHAPYPDEILSEFFSQYQ